MTYRLWLYVQECNAFLAVCVCVRVCVDMLYIDESVGDFVESRIQHKILIVWFVKYLLGGIENNDRNIGCNLTLQ